jgi:hypothetical protein
MFRFLADQRGNTRARTTQTGRDEAGYHANERHAGTGRRFGARMMIDVGGVVTVTVE